MSIKCFIFGHVFTYSYFKNAHRFSEFGFVSLGEHSKCDRCGHEIESHNMNLPVLMPFKVDEKNG